MSRRSTIIGALEVIAGVVGAIAAHHSPILVFAFGILVGHGMTYVARAVAQEFSFL